MDKYYFLENKSVLGPYTSTELSEKKINLDSLICKTGTNEWKKIADSPELDSLRQTLRPSLPKEIRNKRKIANFIIETFQKIFSKKTLLILCSFLILGLLTGLSYFYLISDGSKSYYEFKEISDYITKNPEQIQKEDNYVNSLTGFEGGRVRNWTSHEAQHFYKERYQKSLEKAKFYAFYSFLFILIITIFLFVTKVAIHWIKSNSDPNTNEQNKPTPFPPQEDNNFEKSITSTQLSKKKETPFHRYTINLLLIIASIILFLIIITQLPEAKNKKRKRTELENTRINKILDSLGIHSNQKDKPRASQLIGPVIDTNKVLSDSEQRKVNDLLVKLNPIIIGTQLWSNENLNVTTFRNGDEIFEANTAAEWKTRGEQHLPAYCDIFIVTNDSKLFGKCYNWYAVNDSRGLAPYGWHIPSEQEFNTLINYVGGAVAGAKRLISEMAWSNKFKTFSPTGFNAYPSYSVWVYENKFVTQNNCKFWTSTVINKEQANFIGISEHPINKNSLEITKGTISKNYGIQCRCINDTIYIPGKNPYL